MEVLGYHKLTNNEKVYFNDIFDFIPLVLPSQEIFDVAITIRKTYNLKLGDSLIAGTALVHGLTIYSRNLKDFEKVAKLNCINPIV